MTVTRILRKLYLSATIIAFVISSVRSQNFPVEPKSKTVLIPKKSKPASSRKSTDKEIIDSLNAVIVSFHEATAVLKADVAGKDSAIGLLNDKAVQQEGTIKNLGTKLDTYKGQNLKLDQSNRILIVFNSIVGVLLLSTLVWFLRNINRKKTKQTAAFQNISTTEINDTPPPVQQGTVSSPGFQSLQNKLEQLERLSKLKEKGILNDDELNRQKQLILGNNS